MSDNQKHQGQPHSSGSGAKDGTKDGAKDETSRNPGEEMEGTGIGRKPMQSGEGQASPDETRSRNAKTFDNEDYQDQPGDEPDRENESFKGNEEEILLDNDEEVDDDLQNDDL